MASPERLRLAATKVRTIAFFERAAKHKRAATVGKADVGSSGECLSRRKAPEEALIFIHLGSGCLLVVMFLIP